MNTSSSLYSRPYTRHPSDLFFSPGVDSSQSSTNLPEIQEQLGPEIVVSTPSPGPTGTADRHVAFKIPKINKSILVHPACRRRPGSGRAGNVLPIDHYIAANGGTTSTFEELPLRLQISKHHKPLTIKERTEELTYINGYLREELAYYKTIRKAGAELQSKVSDTFIKLSDNLEELSRSKWYEEVIDIHAKQLKDTLEKKSQAKLYSEIFNKLKEALAERSRAELHLEIIEIHTKLKEALEERSHAETQAEAKLLNYWNIKMPQCSLEGRSF
jgi:hypothetical protein